jgi:hypothetical protein
MKLFIDPDGDLDAQDPEKGDLDFQDTLRSFLSPYQAVANKNEADKFFTTAELVTKLQIHYGLSTSDPEERTIYGPDLVTEMHALGFTSANIGGQLFWIMKKKP